MFKTKLSFPHNFPFLVFSIFVAGNSCLYVAQSPNLQSCLVSQPTLTGNRQIELKYDDLTPCSQLPLWPQTPKQTSNWSPCFNSFPSIPSFIVLDQ